MRAITHLVVHCSATPPSLDVGVKEIRAWHLERGFSDVGYHYIIRRDGLVEEGRPVEQVGAHVSGHNASTIGICMVGGVAPDSTPQNNFNSRQFDALYALLLTLHAKFQQAEVCGHRDFPNVAKACPSFDVRDWCKSRALKPDFSNVSAYEKSLATYKPDFTNVVSGVTTTAPKG